MVDYVIKTPRQLGAMLRGYRKDRGLTQQEIGARATVAQPTVSQMEDDPGPSALSRLLKILAALDLELVIRERKKTQDQTDW